MSTTRYLASVAVAIGAAAILAVPAAAQSSVDQAFLQAVRDKGVPIASDGQALDLAHQTCGVLNNGGSATDALSKIAGATNWSTDQAANFGSLAVVAYCKDKMAAALAPQPQQSPGDSGSGAKPRINVPRYTPPNEPGRVDHRPYGEIPCRDASGCD
jgi:hypothetical protein